MNRRYWVVFGLILTGVAVGVYHQHESVKTEHIRPSMSSLVASNEEPITYPASATHAAAHDVETNPEQRESQTGVASAVPLQAVTVDESHMADPKPSAFSDDRIQTEYDNGRAVSYVNNQLILKLAMGATEKELVDFLAKHQLKLMENENLKALRYISVETPAGADVQAVRQSLFSDPQARLVLKSAEPNYIADVMAINDPLYSEQWYLEDTGFAKAWESAKGINQVLVAVVDTGVDAEHPDLAGRCKEGVNTISGDQNTADGHGHGTHSAGLIAGAWNNIGIRGACPANIEILPIKSLDDTGKGSYEDAAEGIVAAADFGAKVINLGFGGYAYSYLLKDAVDYALEKGCLIVAAAGNDGAEAVMYPAGYPDVIAVGALGQDDKILPLSNRGSHIAVVAPGHAILSTTLNGKYATASGSSPAAAIASSLAALLVSEKTDYSAAVIRQTICQSAVDLGETGQDTVYGFGKIDVQAALAKEVGKFHDVAVRSIDIEPKEFSASKPTYIVVGIENAGTYPAETCDVVVYRKCDAEREEIARQCNVAVSAKQNIPFEWSPTDKDVQVLFEAEVMAENDLNLANNKRMSPLYSLSTRAEVHILYATEPPVHQWIAYQAFKKLKSSGLMSTEMENEFQDHIGATSDDDDHLLPYWSYTFTEWDDLGNKEPAMDDYELLEGTWEEDGGGGFVDETRGRPASHFWDPDLTYDAGMPLCDSALEVAQHHFLAAVDNWDEDGNERAFYWLGRTAHLLMDMSVPAHVLRDPHIGWDHDNYETLTADQYRNINSASEYTDMPSLESLNALPSRLLASDSSVPNEYNDNLTKLFWNLAECGDDFPSNDRTNDCDSTPNGYGIPASGIDYGDRTVQQQQLESRAIGYVAALYQIFLQRTHPTIQVTVSTSPADQGLQINVDGTTYTGSKTFNWTNGTPHTIAAIPSGDYEFNYWSDRADGVNSHTVSPIADIQYVASFKVGGSGPYAIMTSSADTYVDEAYPTLNGGDSTIMWATSPTGGRSVSLVKFNVASAIPAGSTINKVELYMTYVAQPPWAIYMSKITSSWIEKGTGGVTWNTKPTYTAINGGAAPSVVNDGVKWTWNSDDTPDLKSLVQYWLDSSSKNYGLMMSVDYGANTYDYFYTREEGDSSRRPRLKVYYTPPATGTLTVYIKPSDARAQGAQWKLTSGPNTSYHDSGDTIPEIPTGSYTLYFSDVAGWDRPSSHNTSISINAGANNRTGTYGFAVSAPDGVTASDGAYNDKVVVQWNSASGATSYEVWRNTANNSGSAAMIGDYIVGTSFDDYNAVAGQTYYYWVKAKNASGTSGFSSSNSGYRQVSPPSAPTGVSASDGSYTDKVHISWNSADGASSYEVWRYTSNSSDSATRIANDVTATSYDDTAATAGQTYYYWIKAKNVGGTSGFSSSDSGYREVPADTQAPIVQITVPTAEATYTSTSPTNRLTIGGTASDNVGVAGVRIRNYRDVADYVCAGTTSWQFAGLPIFQGTNRIAAVATDSFGNSATDVLSVTYSGDAFYDAELRSGAVLQEIDFPDNLTPGSVVPVRWKLLSYVPVRSCLETEAETVWRLVKNGAFTGVEDSIWNIEVSGKKKYASLYSFACDWTVPNHPGDFRTWFNVSQQDGRQYMIATVPEGVDDRPDPSSSKVVLRTILAGGTDADPQTETRLGDPAEWQFDTLDDIKKRSGGTIIDLDVPDNMVVGTRATCQWTVMAYMDIDAEVYLVDMASQSGVGRVAGTRTAATESDYHFTFAGTTNFAKEYTFRTEFVVPDAAGVKQIYFRHRLRGDANSTWMAANIAPGVDARPYLYNGMYGRFIERTIVSP